MVRFIMLNQQHIFSYVIAARYKPAAQMKVIQNVTLEYENNN